MTNINDLAKTLWDYNNLNQPVRKSDCILVLGSNDIRVAQRGAELFLQGHAPLLIFSGNVGRLTKGLWTKPEAEIFAEEAIKMGVPKDKILIENESTNTGENISFTKKLLDKKGISINSIILVQKPYMKRRAYATFKKLWPEKEVIVTAPQITFESYPNEIISKDVVINIMVGDTQRIKLYPEKGFQIPQDMPENVWNAYKELVEHGYTKHLIK
jgi:uncharacterized SAM-binding protein YcdF (DUF218 family)